MTSTLVIHTIAKHQFASLIVREQLRNVTHLRKKPHFLTFLINVVTSLPTKDAVNSGALGSKRCEVARTM